MKTFPKITKKVSPLYKNNHQQQIAPGGRSFRSRVAFRYRSALKVIRSNMYEPVAVITPKYSERNGEEIVPPEKPPRKNKIRRQNNSHEAPDNAGGFSENMKILRDLNNGDATCIVDVDQINLQAGANDDNFKRKSLVEIAVQTSHLIPYRLRFWPKSCRQLFKLNPDEKICSLLRLKCCCTVFSQWILSQFGLTLVVISWALLGALAFYRTEGPRELQQAKNLEKLRKDLSIELTTILVQTYKFPSNWATTVNDYMQKHEDSLLEAVSEGFGEGGGGNIWTYPGCILFAVSLLTTLGFGAPVPRTALGRGAAVLFSAVGIPLHFLLILNMGHLGAIKLQRLAFSGSTEIPTTPRPKWLQWFPVAAIFAYYLLGVIFFGAIRERGPVDSIMFPLDFTAAGGVGKTCGHVRILYALYLEFAVTLAALVVSLIQASATRGIVDVGLKLGLLTNT